MKKVLFKIAAVTLAILLLFVLASCGDCDHEYGAWEVEKGATCTKTGVRTRTCEKCGKEEKETIEALGHNYVDGVCTVCGEQE